MHKLLITCSSAALLALAGCASTAPAPEAAPAPKAEVKPSLTEEAKAALAKAEADVKEAKARKALWTTAEDALKRAQDAAASFDSAAVIKNAAVASDHVKMGLAQLQYPMTNAK